MKRSNIWFTADTHWNHKNIVRGVSRWKNPTDSCRDFDTLEEYNNHLIDQINKHVYPDDILYHLGDWSFGGIGSMWEFRKRLNVETVHLVLGNHDQHVRANKVLPNVYKDETTGRLFNGEPNPASFKLEVRAQEIFTSVQEKLYLKLDGSKRYITLDYFANEVWYDSHKGAFHLHGHSHDTLPPIGRRLDVGLESAKKLLGEWRPFNWNEIIKILNKKEIHKVDHHDEKTT